MIPPFDENGYLPPGIHPATLGAIEARFGRESDEEGFFVRVLPVVTISTVSLGESIESTLPNMADDLVLCFLSHSDPRTARLPYRSGTLRPRD